jgi:hypothetical protein
MTIRMANAIRFVLRLDQRNRVNLERTRVLVFELRIIYL